MAPLKKTPSHVAGYDVFPLTLLPLPSLAQQVTHYLYITPHKPKIPTATAPRSLFLVNVPFDATEAHIKHLLSAQIGLPAGRVEDVEFEGQRRHVRRASEVAPTTSKPNKKNKKRKRNTEGESLDKLEGVALPATWDRDLHTNGLAAVVLFVDRVSMDAALRAIKSTRKERIPPTWGDNMEGKTPALGSARYLNHHQLSFPNKALLLQSVNDYMTAFAAKEASQARLATKQRQEADADGFITVTKGGRTNPARQEAAQEQAEKLKDKQKGLEDFYRFQSREKRKERAGELVRKFEEDKERVRKMRENRGRFKPE